MKRWNRIGCGLWVMVLTLVLAGCAGAPAGGEAQRKVPAAESTASVPIPDNLREQVKQSESLGAELYIADKMAAIGTDAMLEKLDASRKARICGYIAMREMNEEDRPTKSWLVTFFVDRDNPGIGCQVRVTPPTNPPGRAKIEVEEFTPPRKPGNGELLLHRAIRTAIAAIPDRPAQPANPVILPGAVLGEEGFLVYVLAGTLQDNTVVLGKHYRVLVRPDGESAYKIEPLTKAVLELPSPPRSSDGTAPMLWVTHLLGDYPLETHVFVSLLHHTTLYVYTENHVWRVRDGKITLVEIMKGKS